MPFVFCKKGGTFSTFLCQSVCSLLSCTLVWTFYILTVVFGSVAQVSIPKVTCGSFYCSVKYSGCTSGWMWTLVALFGLPFSLIFSLYPSLTPWPRIWIQAGICRVRSLQLFFHSSQVCCNPALILYPELAWSCPSSADRCWGEEIFLYPSGL